MRFTPLTPDRLADELATWVESLLPGRTRVGIDGAAEIGATDLADAVAERLRSRGRPVVRASTVWWWRPASLRLEYGHRDVDMLLTGWVDSGSLRRELLDPLASGGSGDHLARLRDPVTDRSLREPRSRADPGTILLLDGPLLLAADLPLDAVVHLQVSSATLGRALAQEHQWWLAGFRAVPVGVRPHPEFRGGHRLRPSDGTGGRLASISRPVIILTRGQLR